MPSDILQTLKKIITNLAAANSTATAIDLLKKGGDISYDNAKASVLHLARAGQKCHWCQKVLESIGLIECSKCKSLNLVW